MRTKRPHIYENFELLNNKRLRWTKKRSKGNANFVFFIDCLAGIKSGFYWLYLPPTYQKKNAETNNKKIDIFGIMKEDF
jgi:hypothetical protein